MDILFLLVPLSVTLAAVIGAVLFWAVNTGQFDEMDELGQSVIDDDDSLKP